MLLLLTFVDVSTFAFFHMRTVHQTMGPKVVSRTERTAAGYVGLETTGTFLRGDYAEHILMYRPLYEMTIGKFDYYGLPRFKLFGAAHLDSDLVLKNAVAREKQDIENLSFSKYESLVLNAETKDVPEYQAFLNARPAAVQGAVEVVSQTYNSMVLKVNSGAQALLFIRDGYSPYWKINVNQQPVPVAPALFNFKAIPVPTGESVVEMRFDPPGIRWAICLSYLVLLGLVGLNIFAYARSQWSLGRRPT